MLLMNFAFSMQITLKLLPLKAILLILSCAFTDYCSVKTHLCLPSMSVVTGVDRLVAELGILTEFRGIINLQIIM
jgi:hypothetical protein